MHEYMMYDMDKYPAPSPSQIVSPSAATTLDLVHTTN